jgi:hypothetical protein
MNTTSAAPQLWGHFASEAELSLGTPPELLWSSALPAMRSYDSWMGADGSDRVVFLGVDSNTTMNATIILHDDIYTQNAPVTITCTFFLLHLHRVVVPPSHIFSRLQLSWAE